MKVYSKIVYDKDMNIIEEESHEYEGPVAQCGGGGGGGNPIKKVFKSVAKVFKKIVKKITSFVGDVFGFLIKPFGLPELGGFDADNLASGVKVTKPGTNIGIPVIYGYRRVGSIPVYAETDGSKNSNLYVVYAVSEGEIQGFRKIYIDGHFVGVSADGVYYTAGKTYNGGGRYANRLSFQCFNGTETQAQSSLANEAPTWASKTRKLPGVAYVVCKFIWKAGSQEEVDANPYGGGLPQLEFELNGKKVYDVATHAGGLDLVNDYADLTKTFSINPANCLLDYLMNPRFGGGFKKEEINADSFKIAADKFNQTVTFDTDTSETGAIMTTNAVIDTAKTILNNTKILLSGARSFLPFVQGRYKLRVEDGGHPTDITSSTVSVAYDVTEDNLIGTVALTGEQKDTKYNQVIVNYIDPMREFSSQQVFYSTAGDVAIDDNEDLTGEFTFETLTNRAIAQDIARMIYDKSRKQRQITFSATQELLDVEVGDIIRVSDAILNLDQVTFRVMGITLETAGNLKLECVEHDATIYPHVSTVQTELPPPVFLPNQYYNKVRLKPQEPVNLNYTNPDSTPPEKETEPTSPICEKFVDPADVTIDNTVYENKGVNSFLFQHKLNNLKNTLTPTPNGLNGAVSVETYRYSEALGTVNVMQAWPTLPDGDVDTIEIVAYQGAQQVFSKTYDYKQNASYFFAPGPIQPGTATTFQSATVRNIVYETLTVPLQQNWQYQVNYINTRTNQKFLSGGDISAWSGFSSYSYTLLGNSRSGTGLEALINYLKDTETQSTNGTPIESGGAVDLGA